MDTRFIFTAVYRVPDCKHKPWSTGLPPCLACAKGKVTPKSWLADEGFRSMDTHIYTTPEHI